MTSPGPVPADDHAVARVLAAEAGQLLLEIRDQGGAAGDAQSHALLMRRLAEIRPDDAVLSEEGADDQARLAHARVWIVDPLDGTREYGEPPRTDWAVHVALVVDGLPAAAAVGLPAQGTVLSTDRPPALSPPAAPPRMVVSRTRAPAWTGDVAAALGAVLVPMGSAGAKIAAVVTGAAEIYVHGGGQYEWDSAAPVAVAQATGLHTSRLDGSALRYNQPNPWLPDLVVCHPDLATDVLAAVRAHYRPRGD